MNAQLSLLFYLLKQRKYFSIFLASTAIFYFFFIELSTILIPGSDIMFQIKLLNSQEHLLLIILSSLIALNIIVQLDRYRAMRKISVKTPLASASAGIIASIFGTPICTACFAPWLVILGVGTWTALLAYRFWITLFSIFMMVLALWFSLRSCSSCYVPNRFEEKMNRRK